MSNYIELPILLGSSHCANRNKGPQPHISGKQLRPEVTACHIAPPYITMGFALLELSKAFSTSIHSRISHKIKNSPLQTPVVIAHWSWLLLTKFFIFSHPDCSLHFWSLASILRYLNLLPNLNWTWSPSSVLTSCQFILGLSNIQRITPFQSPNDGWRETTIQKHSDSTETHQCHCDRVVLRAYETFLPRIRSCYEGKAWGKLWCVSILYDNRKTWLQT